MFPCRLHAFWRRTTESMQQTPLHATCTDARAGRREYVTSLVQLNSFEGSVAPWYTRSRRPYAVQGSRGWPSRLW